MQAECVGAPSGLGMFVVALVVAPPPALALGFALGRVHAWSALAVSCAAGPATLPIAFMAMGDTRVEMYTADSVADLGGALLPVFAIPLVVGGACGAFCRALRAG